MDLNTSSWMLLRYVAGVTERVALNIVSYRDEHGRFHSRKQLNHVPGIDAKTFEQAAGFRRPPRIVSSSRANRPLAWHASSAS